MVRLLIDGAEDLLRFRRQRGHALATARAGADQHQAADQFRFGDGQRLCDEASQRKAEHIDLGKAECLDERGGVGGHLLDGGRDLARARRDAGIVEQDDLAILGEAVRHRRVPMIHRAGEMDVEDDRHAAGLAEAAIGKADSVGLDVLCRRGLVSVRGHVHISLDWRIAPGSMPSFSSRVCGSK